MKKNQPLPRLEAWVEWTAVAWIVLVIIIAVISTPIKVQAQMQARRITIEFDSQRRIQLYDHAQQKIVDISLEEYIVGVVAAEMPALYHPEALKAQAVAARTYLVRNLALFGGHGCAQNPGADVCSSYLHCQAYEGIEQRRGKWNEQFYTYENKIRQCVQQTMGEIITYEGQPILALYHSCSGGRTEAAMDVFGESFDYLIAVDSPGEDHPNMSVTTPIALDEFIRMLDEKYPKAGITRDNIHNEIEIVQRRGNRVDRMRIGTLEISATDFRAAMQLKSTAFDIIFNQDQVLIQTIGSGHGVGMSQAGANKMAQEGYRYKQIITHYYPHVFIEDDSNTLS